MSISNAPSVPHSVSAAIMKSKGQWVSMWTGKQEARGVKETSMEGRDLRLGVEVEAGVQI